MLSACEYLSKNLEKVTLPFLVMHGADDDIVKMEESSKLLYERASSVDKTLKVWPNEWHNFLMSPNYKVFFSFSFLYFLKILTKYLDLC